MNRPIPHWDRSLALENGDQLAQPEFHRRYLAQPEDVKCELIGGTVFMPSPLRYPHGTFHVKLGTVLGLYEAATPGVEAADNVTDILGQASEPQPDLILRIRSDRGGRSRIDPDEYLVGPPELVVEVALSSRAIDLHQKRADYEQAGVIEYLVVCVEERQIFWFHFPGAGELQADGQGIYRSQVFPGLWLDGPALLAQNLGQMIAVVQQGVATPDHAAFVQRLQQPPASGS